MSWWRRNWRWMLAVALSTMASIAIVVLVVLRKNKQVAELRSKLALSTAAAQVAGLEADKKARRLELVVNRQEARAVEEEILKAKRETLRVVANVDEMSDARVAVEFRKLGY